MNNAQHTEKRDTLTELIQHHMDMEDTFHFAGEDNKELLISPYDPDQYDIDITSDYGLGCLFGAIVARRDMGLKTYMVLYNYVRGWDKVPNRMDIIDKIDITDIT